MSLLTRPIAVYLSLGRTVAIGALMGATFLASPPTPARAVVCVKFCKSRLVM